MIMASPFLHVCYISITHTRLMRSHYNVCLHQFYDQAPSIHLITLIRVCGCPFPKLNLLNNIFFSLFFHVYMLNGIVLKTFLKFAVCPQPWLHLKKSGFKTLTCNKDLISRVFMWSGVFSQHSDNFFT